MSDPRTLSGPDFLEALADAELASGNEINADTYRQRARQWRAEQEQHDATAAALASLQRRVAAANQQLAAAA
ncbi:MAG: hypothetical protein H0V63_00965 [Burkholderiaceae bacterium]|nr:hypothetical protein [Burkholderiaceae bacterium]